MDLQGQRADKFLISHSDRELLLHAGNIKEFDSYISESDPDVVIIEAAERTMSRQETLSASVFQWRPEWFGKLFPDK